jgi:DNA-binding NtrC family response regulator
MINNRQTKPSSEEEHILFVDDDPNLLASIMRKFGGTFHVVTAKSGEEALAILAGAGKFAAVVADMRMRGMDGVVLLRECRRRQPDTMRILLTGLSDQATAVRAINEGHVLAFLNKPVTPEALQATLEDALVRWRMQRNEREFIRKETRDIDLS